MTIETNVDTVGGVKIAAIVFAFLGAAVSLAYQKEMTRGQVVTGVFVGVAVSVATTPLVLHYFSMPDSMERGISFLAGLVAMRAIPVVFSLVDRLKGVKLPGVADKGDAP